MDESVIKQCPYLSQYCHKEAEEDDDALLDSKIDQLIAPDLSANDKILKIDQLL